jgi:hypothetical protein
MGCKQRQTGFNLAYLLIAINLTFFLWPYQIIDSNYHQYLLLITQYLNPMILFLYLCIFLVNKNKIHLTNIFYVSIFYSLVLIISSLLGNDPIKNICIAIFFSLSAICILNVYKYDYIKWPINTWILKFLILWSSLPVILIIVPDFQSLFLDGFENSFHGFANGRIEYGFWTTITILLSITYRASLNKHVLRISLFLMFTGLFLSQSRSSFIALACCLIYAVNKKYRNSILKVLIFSLVFVILTFILLSWEYFGRQNSLLFLNAPRLEVYTYYFNQISLENFFFGYGGQNSMPLKNFAVTQAHNLLIQWLSNWGMFGLLTLILFLYLFWKGLDSIYPRMLFIALLFYSLTQPIQGTANFFGPVTLLCFFIIIGMQCDYASKKITP